jgi:serine/threonine protein phosphatase PrpC
VKAFAVCDKGKVRSTNQDIYAIRYCCEDQIAILVVCDGMGGANAGNVASEIACDTFVSYVSERVTADMQPDERCLLMKEAVEHANEKVHRLSIEKKEYQGMGTTLVAAVCCAEYQLIANVGDSRAYRVSPEHITKITSDHSYLQEMIRQGKMTPEEAELHPAKNLITRAVGVDPFVEADYYKLSLKGKDKLLLCSDGLCGLVSDDAIFKIMQKHTDMETTCQALKDAAMENGGHDNITALLFSLEPAASEHIQD